MTSRMIQIASGKRVVVAIATKYVTCPLATIIFCNFKSKSVHAIIYFTVQVLLH